MSQSAAPGLSPASLNMLGVIDIVTGIRSGAFSAEEVLHDCLARIDERDKQIKAWIEVDRKAAERHPGPAGVNAALSGVPFAVKDVMDTADLPTQMGSDLYAGHRAPYDAGVVAQVRMAGGVVLDKTATCEFAGIQPTDTVNPLDPTRTPGGSSSGSAAAVADFHVPFAFGTQTAGSVLRPAAFNGVVGFKPTFGLYAIAGVKQAAQSFDTVGLIARNVEDVAAVHHVLMSSENAQLELGRLPRVGLFRSHLSDTLEEDADEAVEAAARLFAVAGAKVSEVMAPVGFETITQHRAVVNGFERVRALAGEWQENKDGFKPLTRDVFAAGLDISGERYIQSRIAVDNFQHGFTAIFKDVDFLLTATVPGEAPLGHDRTGDPRLQEIWTMLHLPSLSLPGFTGRNGLPLGLQLIGRGFGDRDLLAQAAWAQKRVTER